MQMTLRCQTEKSFTGGNDAIGHTGKTGWEQNESGVPSKRKLPCSHVFPGRTICGLMHHSTKYFSITSVGAGEQGPSRGLPNVQSWFGWPLASSNLGN